MGVVSIYITTFLSQHTGILYTGHLIVTKGCRLLGYHLSQLGQAIVLHFPKFLQHQLLNRNSVINRFQKCYNKWPITICSVTRDVTCFHWLLQEIRKLLQI